MRRLGSPSRHGTERLPRTSASDGVLVRVEAIESNVHAPRTRRLSRAKSPRACRDPFAACLLPASLQPENGACYLHNGLAHVRTRQALDFLALKGTTVKSEHARTGYTKPVIVDLGNHASFVQGLLGGGGRLDGITLQPGVGGCPTTNACILQSPR
jgi:hypothetical protein